MKIKYLVLLIPIFLLISGFKVYGEERMTADEIIKEMTETMNPQQSHGIMEMTIQTTTGQERTFVYETFSKDGGDRNLMKYLEPTRVKGQSILMLNDASDIWIYFPRTRRVRKLATHAKKQKLEGSDFSYEDMGASDEFIEEFNSELLGEEQKHNELCYKIELVRKENSTSGYSRAIVWVEKDFLVPRVIDYYHDDDPELLEKELVMNEVQKIDGIYTPMKMIMNNKLDNTKTVMEIREISYDVNHPDNLFTEMGMKK